MKVGELAGAVVPSGTGLQIVDDVYKEKVLAGHWGHTIEAAMEALAVPGEHWVQFVLPEVKL